jgi:hypothetical protein
MKHQCNKILLKIVSISILIIVLTTVYNSYYLLKEEPRLPEVFGVAEFKNCQTGKIDYPVIVNQNFSCLQLKRLDDKILKFCEGELYPNGRQHKCHVGGQYNLTEDTIYLPLNSQKDVIIHELYHSVDMFRRKKDQEFKAYEFQSLYGQLVSGGKL